MTLVIQTPTASVDSVTVTRDQATLRVVALFTQDDEFAADVAAYLNPLGRRALVVPHPAAVRSSTWEVFASTPDGTRMPKRGARGGGTGEERKYTWMFDVRQVPDGDPIVVHICEGAITLFATYLAPRAVS